MIRERASRALLEAEHLTAQEMEIARLVQVKLLPQGAPALRTLDCVASCVQARAVGGDYFDYIDLGSNQVALVLADVSGKGISAALLMANLQGDLRAQAARMAEDLTGSMQLVNRLFYECTESGRYATIFVGVYDDATRRLSYVNCGHNPPVLLRGGTIHRLPATATVLGLFDSWECVADEITLVPDDIFAIYSDGVTEATNADKVEFGESGLVRAMLENRHSDVASIVKAIGAAVDQFTEGEVRDDVTLMVARIR
jgi:serine phosphatase RsbU (regulator of sigma subunit)